MWGRMPSCGGLAIGPVRSCSRIVLRGRVPVNHVSRLFRCDVNGTDDEKSRNLGKDRSVHHAQAGDAVHFEIGVQDPIFAFLANLAGTRSVVSPSVIAHEFLQLIFVVHAWARNLLFLYESLRYEPRRKTANELDAFHD